MNPVEKTNIKALAEALSAACKQETKLDTTADFISALHSEPDKKKRKKLIKDFTARHADAAAFFSENEALINAEAEAALISAAVSGNVNALKFYLKNRLPEKYSDKPKETVEIEDISGIEEKIYGSENEKDHTV